MDRRPPTDLRRLRTISRIFDELIPIPGTRWRLGLDSIIGLLPGGGDLIGGAVSAYALLLGARLGAPPSVMIRMALNIVIDALIGAIPLLGDLFDVGWKANRRNADLLERYALEPQRTRRGSLAVLVMALLMVFGVLGLMVWLVARLLGALF
jgi:hypothetical protein